MKLCKREHLQMRIFRRNKNGSEGNVLLELLLWHSNFKNTMGKRDRIYQCFQMKLTTATFTFLDEDL